jgi:hypothetical protein
MAAHLVPITYHRFFKDERWQVYAPSPDDMPPQLSRVGIAGFWCHHDVSSSLSFFFPSIFPISPFSAKTKKPNKEIRLIPTRFTTQMAEAPEVQRLFWDWAEHIYYAPSSISPQPALLPQLPLISQPTALPPYSLQPALLPQLPLITQPNVLHQHPPQPRTVPQQLLAFPQQPSFLPQPQQFLPLRIPRPPVILPPTAATHPHTVLRLGPASSPAVSTKIDYKPRTKQGKALAEANRLAAQNALAMQESSRGTGSFPSWARAQRNRRGDRATGARGGFQNQSYYNTGYNNSAGFGNGAASNSQQGGPFAGETSYNTGYNTTGDNSAANASQQTGPFMGSNTAEGEPKTTN